MTGTSDTTAIDNQEEPMTHFAALGYVVTLHPDPDCPAELAEQLGVDGTPWCYDIASADAPEFVIASCTAWADEAAARDAAMDDVRGMIAKSNPAGLPIPGALPVLSAEGHLFQPWTDGWAVGFKVTHGTTGEVRHVYLNPSSDDDPTGDAVTFVYQGCGDIVIDDAIVHLDAFND